MPDAVALNEVFPFKQTLAFAGGVVTVAASETVSIAAVDVLEEGQALLTITLYWLLFIALVTAVNGNVTLVAPVILLNVNPPFALTCHW